MLTSFFGNSKPINYIILGLFITVFCVLQFPGVLETTLKWSQAPLLIVLILGWVFGMLLIDFIIRKNQITQIHTLGIFVFVCIASVFSIPKNWEWLAALLFLLLAFRRICSLHSSRNREKKIVDATLWTLLASFFFAGAICFLGLLYLALFQINKPKFRYFLIPLVVATAVVLMAIAGALWMTDGVASLWMWWEPISLDFTVYNSPKKIIAISIISALFIWCFIHFLNQIPKQAKKRRPFYRLVAVASFVFILMPLLIPKKDGSEFIFWSISGSLLITPYLEKKTDFIFKEAIAFVLIVLPIAMLFLD